MSVVYLRSRRRRPVWVGVRPSMEDVGGEIPYGWCDGCGMECYLPGQSLCGQCEEKERNVWKRNIDIPVELAPVWQILNNVRINGVYPGEAGLSGNGK